MSRHAHGLRAWLWQRVSAAYVGLFIVYLTGHFVFAPPDSYDAWRAWVSAPGVSVAFSLFLGALIVHVWVGMRDVVMDYFGAVSLRLAVLLLVALVLAGSGVWALRVLWVVTPA